ncbi:hypothetical protein MKJ04_03485 [Pontibacter sp. E15-1]|uniref:hypothetical protein n=1 Tax=Pontibacter sp. E15-1 TaxID=2919918 RepID=UPI001F501E81|nr:hypothetical protein [Pontibacter sp. E15-1]MCJ8163889.1 hypothetical protein [Pontibacter sp. E15-1]
MASPRTLSPAPEAHPSQRLIRSILEQPTRYEPDREIVYRNLEGYFAIPIPAANVSAEDLILHMGQFSASGKIDKKRIKKELAAEA